MSVRSSDPIAVGYNVVRIVGFGMLAMIVITAIFGGFYSVDEGERGIQLRGGSITGVADPGFHLKMPILETVEFISIRTERAAFSDVSSYSKDQQVATLAISVNFRYDPSYVEEIYTQYGTDGYPVRILQPRVLEATKTVFGRFNAVSAIQERERLNLEIKDAVIASIGNTGAVIEGVLVENIDFSANYEASIEARMQAEVEVQRLRQALEQDIIKADQNRTQALGNADARRFEAQAEADALKFKAIAESEATKLRGAAEATSIDARGEALRRNPDLVKLIQAERWSGTLPTHMIPNATVPFLDIK